MNAYARNAIKMATVAAAALPLMAFTWGAHAEGVHVAVGDLSQADQAAAFAHRLDKAAEQLCHSFPDNIHRRALEADCAAEVRSEAMAQLTSSQRLQFAAYSRNQWASAR